MPIAVARDFPSKSPEIIFGAPTDINGPPTPKRATASHSSVGVSAMLRATPEAAITNAASANAGARAKSINYRAAWYSGEYVHQWPCTKNCANFGITNAQICSDSAD